MPKFEVITGTPAPDTPAKRVRALPKPATMIQCHRCGGREVIETKVGMLFKHGRAQGGTRTILCATCHRQGERVVLV